MCRMRRRRCSSTPPMQRCSHTARHASRATNARLALVGDVASKAAQLGVMVLAARLLSTRELAVFGICLTLATVLTVALDAGVSTVLVRECASRPRRGWASAAAA